MNGTLSLLLSIFVLSFLVLTVKRRVLGNRAKPSEGKFALAVMYLVNAFGLLRVSKEGEAYGLDLHEHGISAYPEYLISSAGRPSGASLDKADVLVGHTAHVSLKPEPSASSY